MNTPLSRNVCLAIHPSGGATCCPNRVCGIGSGQASWMSRAVGRGGDALAEPPQWLVSRLAVTDDGNRCASAGIRDIRLSPPDASGAFRQVQFRQVKIGYLGFRNFGSHCGLNFIQPSPLMIEPIRRAHKSLRREACCYMSREVAV